MLKNKTRVHYNRFKRIRSRAINKEKMRIQTRLIESNPQNQK